MKKTKNFIYWISLIGPLWDCVYGFVKGVYTVIHSGEILEEFKKAQEERAEEKLNNYILETKLKIHEDLDND